MSYPDTIRWSADGRGVDIIDQLLLPEQAVRVELRSADEVARAIRTMQIRGAPAIGIAAAMGLALELSNSTALSPDEFRAKLQYTTTLLASTRPTAVNLFWALERMSLCAEQHRARTPGEIACKLYGEASAILEEDRAMCRAIGEHALTLFPDPAAVLTHCNAGSLATGGMGTALAAVHLAHERGLGVRVYSDETRPALQGSRLTAWELSQAGIDVTVITDNVAGSLMRTRHVDLVIVGADRIAANGDVANKIGTYPLAVLAKHHGIPFFVAAPSSTVDLATPTGAEIPIEERNADEVRRGFGKLTAPPGAKVFSPAFDVTPHELITAIITEHGVHRAPFADALRSAVSGAEART
jgi:methylthioribose-1-phosphate isomerase